MKLIDALISPILFYASEEHLFYGGLISMDNIRKRSSRISSKLIPEVVAGSNKYCNNNGCRAETARVLQILSLTKILFSTPIF